MNRLGLIGEKVGMTQIFEDNVCIPVTVIKLGPNVVVRKKTSDSKDGYNALQLGFKDKDHKKLSKPQSNFYKKRDIKRNRDLVVTECRPWATDEQFELLTKYLSVRHPDGGMSTMDELDYADMVEHTPVTSTLVEYREPTADGSPGRLVGACARA